MTEKPTKMGDGINSGTWAVRGEHYQAVMEVWEAIEMTRPQCMTQWTEQGAWNRLIFEVGRMRDVKEPADPLEGSVLPNLLLGKLAGIRGGRGAVSAASAQRLETLQGGRATARGRRHIEGENRVSLRDVHAALLR